MSDLDGSIQATTGLADTVLAETTVLGTNQLVLFTGLEDTLKVKKGVTVCPAKTVVDCT